MVNFIQNDLKVSDLLKGNVKLLSPPSVYNKLQKLTENSNFVMADIAAIIENDPALTMRLLKIVNSAFYGYSGKIVNVKQAICLIGIKEIRLIVLSTFVIEKFSVHFNDLMSMKQFWYRSLRCALIAKQLDVCTGKKHADEIFVCGLLHNIGFLIFLDALPELTQQVMLQMRGEESQCDYREVAFQQRIIGFDHYQTGSALARLWKLPEIITQSIALHNDPQQNGEYCFIANLVLLADICSKRFEGYADPLNFKALGLTKMEVKSAIHEALENLDDLYQSFAL